MDKLLVGAVMMGVGGIVSLAGIGAIVGIPLIVIGWGIMNSRK